MKAFKAVFVICLLLAGVGLSAGEYTDAQRVARANVHPITVDSRCAHGSALTSADLKPGQVFVYSMYNYYGKTSYRCPGEAEKWTSPGGYLHAWTPLVVNVLPNGEYDRASLLLVHCGGQPFVGDPSKSAPPLMPIRDNSQLAGMLTRLDDLDAKVKGLEGKLVDHEDRLTRLEDRPEEVVIERTGAAAVVADKDLSDSRKPRRRGFLGWVRTHPKTSVTAAVVIACVVTEDCRQAVQRIVNPPKCKSGGGCTNTQDQRPPTLPCNGQQNCHP